MEFDTQFSNRWIVSIAAGALTVSTWLIAINADAFSLMQPIGIGLGMIFSAVAGLLGLLSILAKEDKRWLAIIGILLGLIPWLSPVVFSAYRAVNG